MLKREKKSHLGECGGLTILILSRPTGTSSRTPPMKHLEDILAKIKEELVNAGKAAEGDTDMSQLPSDHEQGPQREFSIKHPDEWHKLLFGLVCRGHGLRTYRKPVDGPKISHVKTSKYHFEEVVWPSFMRHGSVVERHLKRLMDELIQDTYPDLDELTIGYEGI
jgi:hypothetical protein